MQEAARPLPSAGAPRARTERELLVLARAGDRAAFERLTVRALPQLLGTARRLLGPGLAAEEAVAEALFRALQRLDGFRGDAAFGTWVHRIVCRVASDRFRERARERGRRERLRLRVEAGDPVAGAGVGRVARGPARRAGQAEDRARLRAAVDRLPPRQRLVVVLHVWEGLSLQEIGRVLAVRYATVKSHLSHARRALRLLLMEETP
jgi:RNA polymerase sigma-70 factor (ECF subfamily)